MSDLQAALDLLRELEWCNIDRCPSCDQMHPKRVTEWHGRFGHADDCKLARLIGAKRGGGIACDCYKPSGQSCRSSPVYDGQPYGHSK